MPLSRAARASSLVAAAVLGFAASEVALARGLQGDDRPVLELAQSDDVELVPTQGGLAVSVPVLLRNAGGVDVAVVDADVAGVQLTLAGDGELASGERGELRLERAVECGRLTDRPLTAPPPVSLTTAAGSRERTLELRLDDGLREAHLVARTACGLLAPAEALQLEPTRVRVVDGIGRLSFDVRNGSASALQIRDLLPADGVQVQLLDGNGDPLALPVDLPPGRSATRAPSVEPPSEVRRWTAVFFLDDCGSPAPGSVFTGGSVFSLVVADSTRVETAPFGNAGGILDEMGAETCA